MIMAGVMGRNFVLVVTRYSINQSLVLLKVSLSFYCPSNYSAQSHVNNIKWGEVDELDGALGIWNRKDVVICSLHCKCRVLEKEIRLLAILNPQNCDNVFFHYLLSLFNSS